MAAQTDALRASSPGTPTSRSRYAERALGALTSTWGLGVIVFVVTWGGGLADPVANSLDVSSHAGINMALHDGLRPRSRHRLLLRPAGIPEDVPRLLRVAGAARDALRDRAPPGALREPRVGGAAQLPARARGARRARRRGAAARRRLRRRRSRGRGGRRAGVHLVRRRARQRRAGLDQAPGRASGAAPSRRSSCSRSSTPASWCWRSSRSRCSRSRRTGAATSRSSPPRSSARSSSCGSQPARGSGTWATTCSGALPARQRVLVRGAARVLRPRVRLHPRSRR